MAHETEALSFEVPIQAAMFVSSTRSSFLGTGKPMKEIKTGNK
jgi:hypothetical protein